MRVTQNIVFNCEIKSILTNLLTQVPPFGGPPIVANIMHIGRKQRTHVPTCMCAHVCMQLCMHSCVPMLHVCTYACMHPYLYESEYLCMLCTQVPTIHVRMDLYVLF